uniref:Uncharacterized protein n=1 Tax=Myotis myotis TaxID=51298 RepID=A0A7J7ZXM5_MYOMY|nr:hypothetical protein mMyoMyo1_009873 [Myotis myotis]
MKFVRGGGGRSPQPSLHPLQLGPLVGCPTARSQGSGLNRHSDIPLTIRDHWLLTAHLPACLITPNCLPCRPGCSTQPAVLSFGRPSLTPLLAWSPHAACCSVIWSSLANPPASLVASHSLFGRLFSCNGCLGFYIDRFVYIDFREGERERKRNIDVKDTSIGCLPYAP